jgi:hypothetical protein
MPLPCSANQRTREAITAADKRPHVKGFLDFKINSKIDSQCGKIATKGINI